MHLDAARLLVGVAVLAAASVQDWRTRRIDDRYWVLLGSIGLGLFVADSLLAGLPWPHYLILVPAAILFYATFYGEELLTEEGWRFRPVRVGLFAVAAAALAAEGYLLWGTQTLLFLQDLTIPVMILVSLGLYLTGLLHGGADVKALMAITLLAPAYPAVGPLPLLPPSGPLASAMGIVYPFSLAVLTNAALVFVFAPFVLLAANARRGDLRFPHALFGRRVPLDALPKFAWIMERVVDGKRAPVLFPQRGQKREEILRDLRGVGAKDVWVMPQIPFIIPLAFGFVLGFVAGNALFAITAKLLGR